MRKILIMALFLPMLVLGCVAPGAPLLEKSELLDEDLPRIIGCQNVSHKNRLFRLPDEFITSSYLTSWTSAWKEGTSEGYREAAEQARSSGESGSVQVIELIDLLSGKSSARARLATSRASSWPEQVTMLSEAVEPFCMFFFIDSLRLFGLVKEVFSELDYPIEIADPTVGVIETTFVERQHLAARWRDRYTINIRELEEGMSVIIVQRYVFINRSGEVFNEGISVGHNEAWILKQVSKRLNEETYQLREKRSSNQ